MAAQKKKRSSVTKKRRALSRIFLSAGMGAILAALAIFVFTFFPVIKEELSYTLKISSIIPSGPIVVPVDTEFGIVIPKLGANARVIADVDPYDSRVYQKALSRGVAHAKGTVYPGNAGNMFLFSHSSVNFYEASRYNSVFYLLSKLEAGDDILVYYRKNTFRYVVTEKKLVDPKEISYLTGKTTERMLTLMTCWPAGTTTKRLLVFATLASQ